MHEKSNVASNRLVKNKNPNDEHYNELIPARYLESNVFELYKDFPHADKLKISTFRKYLKMSGEFKKPFRWTDLCDYCEKGKQLKANLTKILEAADYEW